MKHSFRLTGFFDIAVVFAKLRKWLIVGNVKLVGGILGEGGDIEFHLPG
jgi:hypothetical protein